MLLFHHFSQPIRGKSFELRFTHRSIGNYTIFLIILYYFFMLVRNKDSLSLIGRVTAEEVDKVMRLLKASGVSLPI